MALGSCITQRNLYINLLIDLIEQDELAYEPKKSNVNSNKALTLSEAPSLSFVPSPTENVFTKFMKMFIETT